MTCYWRQLFHSPVGTEAPAQSQAPQHWQHLREGCSVQRQNPAGSKKGRMRKSSLEGFRAAGQVLPLPCGKPTLAGSAGRTLAVENTHRSRGACGRWRTEVLLWIVFPTLSTLPEKKPNKQQAISLCSSYPQTFFFFLPCFLHLSYQGTGVSMQHQVPPQGIIYSDVLQNSTQPEL